MPVPTIYPTVRISAPPQFPKERHSHKQLWFYDQETNTVFNKWYTYIYELRRDASVANKFSSKKKAIEFAHQFIIQKAMAAN